MENVNFDWRDKPSKLRQKDRAARWTVKTTKAKPRAGETPMVDLAIPRSATRTTSAPIAATG